MRGVGDGKLGEMTKHDLHQLVLEPDAGGAEGGALVTAVRPSLGFTHGFPLRRSEQWKFVGG